MTHKNLPPLEVGATYRVADFAKFEWWSGRLTGEATATLRLHLKNGTILEIPATEEELQYLQHNLNEAFPKRAVEYAKTRWKLRDPE